MKLLSYLILCIGLVIPAYAADDVFMADREDIKAFDNVVGRSKEVRQFDTDRPARAVNEDRVRGGPAKDLPGKGDGDNAEKGLEIAREKFHAARERKLIDDGVRAERPNAAPAREQLREAKARIEGAREVRHSVSLEDTHKTKSGALGRKIRRRRTTTLGDGEVRPPSRDGDTTLRDGTKLEPTGTRDSLR